MERDATRQEVGCWRRGDVGGPQFRARLHMVQLRAALTTQQVEDRGWVCIAWCDAARCDATEGRRRQIEIIETCCTGKAPTMAGWVHGPRRALSRLRLRCAAVVIQSRFETKYRYSRSPGGYPGTAVLQEPGSQDAAALPWRTVDLMLKGSPRPALAHP